MVALIAASLRATLNGASQILLQTHPGCGLLVLVAIGLQDRALLAGALVGLLAGTGFAWFCSYPRRDIETGLYGYNAALLGLLITLVLGGAPLAWPLILVASMLCVPLQRRLLERMRRQGRLPGFTLPFVLLGWLTLGLCGVLGGLIEARLPEPEIGGWGALGGMLRGIGQVLFLSAPAAGLCLLVALCWADRNAALWALCGSAIGIYAALLSGAAESQALAGLAGYNPALAAVALSQVHRSALFPALGIALAIAARLAFEQLGIAPLTMPFILACWAVAFGLRLARQHARRTTPGIPPSLSR